MTRDDITDFAALSVRLGLIVALAVLALTGCSVEVKDNSEMQCIKGHDQVIDGEWLGGEDTQFVCDEYAPKEAR